jgi:mRNA interferase RelE/StbE
MGMAAGMYSIEVRPNARHALAKLDPALRREAAVLIDGLASDPRPNGAKPLTGKLRGMHRVKFGSRASHRLLYVVEEQAKRVTIAAVGKRGDVYKQRQAGRLKGRGK